MSLVVSLLALSISVVALAAAVWTERRDGAWAVAHRLQGHRVRDEATGEVIGRVAWVGGAKEDIVVALYERGQG